MKENLNDPNIKYLEMISDDLRMVKVNPKLKGFTYLTHAIYLSSINNIRPKTMKSVLLTKIAEMFDTRVENVERGCRSAIESAYFNDGFKKINQVLDFDFLAPYERPTLTSFISTFAQKYILLIAKDKLQTSRLLSKKSLTLKSNKLFNPAFNFVLNL